MKYKLNLSPKLDFSSPPASGALMDDFPPRPFVAWQPSTWPSPPKTVDEAFVTTLKRIFEESILFEIQNVISDAQKCNGDLQHRGHVIAISLMCALEAVSSYGYPQKRQFADFIREHFPTEYVVYADKFHSLYRNWLVHSWNLFEAAIYPGDEPVTVKGGTLSFGLLSFFQALVAGVEDFLEKLAIDPTLQRRALGRYTHLRNSAKP